MIILPCFGCPKILNIKFVINNYFAFRDDFFDFLIDNIKLPFKVNLQTWRKS